MDKQELREILIRRIKRIDEYYGHSPDALQALAQATLALIALEKEKDS